MEDISTFIFNKSIDVRSGWFYDIWLPLCINFNKESTPIPQIRNKIIITSNILDWIGYTGKKEADKKKEFVKFLKRNDINFEQMEYTRDFLDYEPFAIDVQKSDPKYIAQKKWIIMNIRDFKKTVMRINTKNAENVREYYMNIEDVLFEYARHQIETEKIQNSKLFTENQQLLEIKDKSDRKANNIKNLMKNIGCTDVKKEWIYIATSKNYAKDRIFKIGSTERLCKRIAAYNTGRVDDDVFFYCWTKKCYKSKDLDYHIQKILKEFKYMKNQEMYIGVKFSDLVNILDFICDNYDKSIDKINDFIKNRLDESLSECDEDIPSINLDKITIRYSDNTFEEISEFETNEIRNEIASILSSIADNQHLTRKNLLEDIAKNVAGYTQRDLWNKIKELLNWKNSTNEIEYEGKRFVIHY